MKAKFAGLALIMGLAMASQAQARTFVPDDDYAAGFAQRVVAASYQAAWAAFDRQFVQLANHRGGGVEEVCYSPGPIPEPGTYAMMLAGLGLMGAIARRRKNGGR